VRENKTVLRLRRASLLPPEALIQAAAEAAALPMAALRNMKTDLV